VPSRSFVRCLVLVFLSFPISTTLADDATFAAVSAYGRASQNDGVDEQPATTAPRVLSSGFPALSPRSTEVTADREQGDAPETAIMTPTITVCSSLAIVLGLFAGFVWLTRRFGGGSKRLRGIPGEMVETLGSTSLDPRTTITLIRIGRRIIIAAQTAQGMQPLSEITHPEEVREMIAACNGHSKSSFASTLKELEHDPVKSGFVVDDTANQAAARRRGRLFETA